MDLAQFRYNGLLLLLLGVASRQPVDQRANDTGGEVLRGSWERSHFSFTKIPSKRGCLSSPGHH